MQVGDRLLRASERLHTCPEEEEGSYYSYGRESHEGEMFEAIEAPHEEAKFSSDEEDSDMLYNWQSLQ